MQRLLLFSVFWLALSLALKPANAQLPGSGGGGLPGSGGSGGGLPGSGGSGGSGSSPSWQTVVSSTGTIEVTTSSGKQAAGWNTYGETQLSSQFLSIGQTVTIFTAGTYHVEMHWLMPDGSAPPTGYGSPPKNVLVDKYCNMGWGGPGNRSAGSADNGLGSPPTESPGFPVHYGQDNGELYTVNDGSSGTITYDILVYATVTSTMTDPGTAIVSVSRNFNVSSNSIGLYLNGTTLDTSNVDNILIGQNCQAGVYTRTPQASFRNYQWSINGNNFKSYVASGGVNGNAAINFLTDADKISSGPAWSWLSEGDGTVTVQADVYVTVSVGIPGIPLTQPIKVGPITDSHPVTVWCPYYKCNQTATSIWIYSAIDVNGNQYAVLSAGLPAVPATPTSPAVPISPSITWTGHTIPQDLFNSAGNGKWYFVQKYIPFRSHVSQGITYNWSINTLPGLDDSYPYAPDQSVKKQNDPTQGWPDNNSIHAASDMPSKPLADYMSHATVGDSFETFMMYHPSNGQEVPLHRIAWSWNASITRPGTSWLISGLPSLIGPVNVSADARWTTHPLWKRVLFADTATYDP